jgi:hypothetical protein
MIEAERGNTELDASGSSNEIAECGYRIADS